MRVKVGDTWHEATAQQALMVELTPADKRNIENMIAGATRYAIFVDEDPRTHEERGAWMDVGAR